MHVLKQLYSCSEAGVNYIVAQWKLYMMLILIIAYLCLKKQAEVEKFDLINLSMLANKEDEEGSKLLLHLQGFRIERKLKQGALYLYVGKESVLPIEKDEASKIMYGLKQTSRSWNKRFDEEIKRFGFDQNLDEPCVYQKASGSNVTFLILYVDDIIIMGETAFLFWESKIYRDDESINGTLPNAYMVRSLKR
ncbi:retrotransposon protein, putative, ty1-copia subclass [Tanacetum coccineum]